MGATNSKAERSNALKLCKERKRFIKQAIDSRYALAAAHVSYVQSLRNIGIALRRYAEAEVLVENSDKTPSHSSYQSPSPSHVGGLSDSPLNNHSPLSPSAARVSYMRTSGVGAMTISLDPKPRNEFMEEREFSMPPPPPPPPEPGLSWDYFDPADESFRFVGQNGSSPNTDDDKLYWNFSKKYSDVNGMIEAQAEMMIPKLVPQSGENGKSILRSTDAGKTTEKTAWQRAESEVVDVMVEKDANGSVSSMAGKASAGHSNSRKDLSPVEKDIHGDREDPAEFITHRAKDFLSSIKDIDNRFFRASESGKEVSRMLESNKIRVGYEARGTSSLGSNYLTSFGPACCQCGTTNLSDDQFVTKVITWKRTTSSRSSSSRNPLANKDDNDDSGSDFIEEFCMIAGSHSSTLDRMYAWERKLYDEVKASESIQKQYDHKCDQLRHQFAKDVSPQIIDKTRATVKDLHSRIHVALHAVSSISKRIEKMRDEELLPQLLELIHGLTRMWKAMLECHHLQYITISLAYHAKNSSAAPPGETQRQIINQLQDEVEYFGLSFADWINSYTSYVEALNSWQQNCILQPRERRGRRALSPRRYVAPPIIVLCRDWCNGIKSLPSQEVSDAIKAFLSELRRSVRNQAEESRKTDKTAVSLENNEAGGEDEAKNERSRASNVSCIQVSLTSVLDRLAKFSEASLKMCEDIKQKCESARKAYENYTPAPRSFSI